MKNYLEFFEPGGEIGQKVFKRFWSNTLNPKKDTFNIPNPSIIGGSYQTIKEIYKQKDEPETLYTWALQKSPNLVWFANNSHVDRLSDGNWVVSTNNSNRNSSIPITVQ